MKPISANVGSLTAGMKETQLENGQDTPVHGSPGYAARPQKSYGLDHEPTAPLPTVHPNREMHPAVMARQPSANTEAVLSKMSSLGVHCSVEMETVFPTKEDEDPTFRQRPTSLKVNIDSSADVPAALKAIHESLMPASEEQLEVWLAELAVKTARRKSSDVGAEMAVSVYVAGLSKYPADTVRHVLTNYRGKWWPTWGELADRLDELAEPRVMMRDHLLRLSSPDAPKQLAHDPVAEKLARLRGDLEAAERVARKYPELEESSRRKREAYAEEIAKLEAGDN